MRLLFVKLSETAGMTTGHSWYEYSKCNQLETQVNECTKQI